MNPPPIPSTAISQQLPELALLISHEIWTRHSLPASPRWILNFLSAIRTPLPPPTALLSTAHFRLLHSDITHSLLSRPEQLEFPSRTNTNTHNNNDFSVVVQPLLLPSQANDPNVKQFVLRSNVLVQVLAIHDIGSSKWTQIEAIERVERGEEVRGREIIRNVPVVDEISESSSTSTSSATTATTTAAASGSGSNVKKSSGPHTLILQDSSGTIISAFELVPFPKIHMVLDPNQVVVSPTAGVNTNTNTNMNVNVNVNGAGFASGQQQQQGLPIGTKILLKKDCLIRRGLVMLRPEHVSVLGGKVDEWDVKWRDLTNRKQRLVQEMESGRRQQQQQQQSALNNNNNDNDNDE